MTLKHFIMYFAGLFDGEGCVAITKNKKRYYVVQTNIVNQNLEVLKKMQYYYGGSLQWRRLSKVWNLQLACKKAYKFLKDIYPFTIIKKEQIKYALEFQNKFGGHHTNKLADSEIAEREKYYKLLRVLKKV